MGTEAGGPGADGLYNYYREGRLRRKKRRGL